MLHAIHLRCVGAMLGLDTVEGALMLGLDTVEGAPMIDQSERR
jgi:hypothetical protein